MKCPRCGHEMSLDGHRKIDMFMCYDCGYIEGRNMGTSSDRPHLTNYERLRGLNFNEAVAFMSAGLGIEEEKLASWMDSTAVIA